MTALDGTTDDIFAAHRRAWDKKRALRLYYQQEIFARIVAQLRPGATLEIGTGPGFFADYHPGMAGLDVAPFYPGVVPGDVHAMPFADSAFTNVVGVDVLHHLARPGRALAEIGRVLTPGGRLILVEPWAGPVGRLFYRYLHHEDCSPVADPWSSAFAAGKDAMEGNAMIPWTLFADRLAELSAHAPLALKHCEPFGIAAYAATGGFQPIGLPWPIIDGLRRFERILPAAIHRMTALRALFVLERQ